MKILDQNLKKIIWIMFRFHQQMLAHQLIHTVNRFKVRLCCHFSGNMLLNIAALFQNRIVCHFFHLLIPTDESEYWP